MSSAPPKAVLIDIDHTLVDCNTGIEIAKQELRGLAALKAIPKLVKLALQAASGQDISKEMLTAAGSLLKGRDSRDAEKLLSRVYENTIKPKIFPQMREKIRQHKADGAKVYLCGTAPQQIADRLASDVGADGAFGSDAERDAQGRLTDKFRDPLPYRKGKITLFFAKLEELGVKPEEARVYSDGYSDLKLLESVGQPYCINPQKPLEKIAKERNWPIERFA